MTFTLFGDWSYRSFHRIPDLTLPVKELLFGAGNLVLKLDGPGLVTGSLGGEGWSLGISGTYSLGNPNRIRFRGRGEIGEEPWVYDYLGYLAEPWVNGVDEVPSLVGTIVRTIPHSNGNAKAGKVASWIAVKKPKS